MFGGRQSGMENEAYRFAVAHPFGMLRGNQSAFHGLCAQFFEIESGTVIANFDIDLATFVIRPKMKYALGWLACSPARFRLFNAVIHSVADHVGQWILDGFNDGLIEFSFGAFHFDAHLFAASGGNIANRSGKLSPDVSYRLHPGFHYPFLQLSGDQIQPLAGCE